MPFAFAKTLNQSMKAVEKYTVARTYLHAFDVRTSADYLREVHRERALNGTATGSTVVARF